MTFKKKLQTGKAYTFHVIGSLITSAHIADPLNQADVNLLAYYLKLITDKDQALRDLEYYSARLPQKNTPAMTQSMFSIICSRFGDTDKAYEWFIDSYRPNQLSPFGVLDLDPEDGVVQVKSHGIPKHWKKLTITGVGTEKKTFVVTR